jgi:hypothetical protein
MYGMIDLPCFGFFFKKNLVKVYDAYVKVYALMPLHAVSPILYILGLIIRVAQIFRK